MTKLPIGYKLKSKQGEYIIKEVLGEGGFGITYKVQTFIVQGNIRIPVYYAIKEHFLKNTCSRDNTGSVCYSTPVKSQVEESLKDFLREAERLNKMTKHPNIVKVNEVFEANNTAYYVMEYLDGQNLRTLRKSEGVFSETEALSIIEPIAGALAFLHNNLYTHLDVKPDNIMMKTEIDGNGHAKVIPCLIDFGLSKHYNKKGKPTSTLRTTGCSDGYSPIEQYQGIETFSPSADVYALSATLFYLLVGKDPVKSADINPGFIRKSLPENISSQTREAILHSMELSSRNRTPDANAFLKSLEKTYTLKPGSKVSSNNYCYCITKLITENENTITYEAVLVNKEDDTNRYVNGYEQNVTVGVRKFKLVEHFEKKYFKRLSDGMVEPKTFDDEYDFSREAEREIGPIHDEQNGLRETFFSSSTRTNYYVIEIKKKPNPISLWKEELANMTFPIKRFHIAKRYIIIGVVVLWLGAGIYYWLNLPSPPKPPIPIKPVQSTEAVVTEDHSSGSISEPIIVIRPDTLENTSTQEQEIQASLEMERKKEQEQARLNISRANTAFANGNYDEALRLYRLARTVLPQDNTGYNNFLNKAKELIGILGAYDNNVKSLLLNAKGLKNTSEVNELLKKCN